MAQEPLSGIVMPGVHAYAEKSVPAGGTIHFKVSSDGPYKIGVYRLGPNFDNPSEDTLISEEVSFSKGQQPIFPGSYVHVENALPAQLKLQGLSLECWVRPWSIEKWQGILGQYSYRNDCGFLLALDDQGFVRLYLGDGGEYVKARDLKSPAPIPFKTWTHIVGVWDGAESSLWINGERVASEPSIKQVRPGSAPIRLAAYGEKNLTSDLLDGDLAMPVIYGRALLEAEIAARYKDKGLTAPTGPEVLGCWPLTEERGSFVHDSSGNGRHGQIINGATWMIGGPSFDAKMVPRFGSYEPAQDERRGHGLRFASDDLYDCGWKTTWSTTLSDNLSPGIYVGRIRHGDDCKDIYDVSFVVTKAPEKEKAPILVLCSTNTWLAYNAAPFAKNHTGSDPRQQWLPTVPREVPTGGTKAVDVPQVREEPRYNFYLNKRSKQPTYKVGLNVPWPVAAPYVIFSDPDDPKIVYSHLTRAERFLHCWLEANGYTFDVITDLDLHKNPSVLDGYEVVILNGHSEYWSVPAYQALERHLSRGKKNITLSGNTICWRVSFNEDFTAMECRKANDTGPKSGGRESASFGECYHSDDGKRGGLMRECGHPAWKLIGLESVGFWEWGRLDSYVCDNPEHPFFKQTELKKDDIFANSAVGHEFDVCANLPQQLAPSDVNPAEIEVLASCGVLSDKTTYWDYKMDLIQPAQSPSPKNTSNDKNQPDDLLEASRGRRGVRRWHHRRGDGALQCQGHLGDRAAQCPLELLTKGPCRAGRADLLKSGPRGPGSHVVPGPLLPWRSGCGPTRHPRPA